MWGHGEYGEFRRVFMEKEEDGKNKEGEGEVFKKSKKTARSSDKEKKKDGNEMKGLEREMKEGF